MTAAARVTSDAPAVLDSAERLVRRAFAGLRPVGHEGMLETRFHHADLGTIRLLVEATGGEIVRAELIAGSERVADALVASAEQVRRSDDALTGIELTVRHEPASGRGDPGTSRGTGTGAERGSDGSGRESATHRQASTAEGRPTTWSSRPRRSSGLVDVLA